MVGRATRMAAACPLRPPRARRGRASRCARPLPSLFPAGRSAILGKRASGTRPAFQGYLASSGARLRRGTTAASGLADRAQLSPDDLEAGAPTPDAPAAAQGSNDQQAPAMLTVAASPWSQVKALGRV